jgi:hypothetical protein
MRALTYLSTIVSNAKAHMYLYAIVSLSTSALQKEIMVEFSEFVTIIFSPCATFLLARWLLF